MARTQLPVTGLGVLVPENSGPVNLYAAPATPVPTATGSGGTVATGTYLVATSFVTPNGETVASNVASIAVTLGQNLNVPSPTGAPLGPANPNFSAYSGFYVYCSQVGGATLTRQQAAGSPTPIGTTFVLSAPPTSSGAAPQLWDPAGTAIDPVNGMVIPALPGQAAGFVTEAIPPGYDAARGLMLRVKNTGASAANVIVRAGAYPPAMAAFLGDLTVAIPGGQTLWVGPLQHGRHVQADDSINVDFSGGAAGTITAFVLPRNVG